jgi:CRP-like cAMP-binding protein
VSRIVGTCTSACAFHQRIIRNLLTVLARKNLAITQKNEHLTKRSTREKVLSYLSSQSRQVGSSSFDIPFNRQQLADYLSVERSALSSCLGKMQKDGVIRFRKSHFELL